MIPRINPLDNSQPNTRAAAATPILDAALSALNQERHEAPPLDDRVSKNPTSLIQAVQYSLDDTRSSYEGEIVNGKYNGHGHLIRKDGFSYKGEFKEDLTHGKGVLFFPLTHTRISLDGEFVNGEPIKGKIEFKNGNSYSGSLKNWQAHGQGTFTYSDGSKYTGELKDGKKSGYGTITYHCGDQYSGEFKDGKKDGSGTYTYISGIRYSGKFKNGEMNGFGTITYPSNDHQFISVEGEFFDKGMANATVIFRDGKFYSGFLLNFKFHGEGYLKLQDGCEYIGEFKDGKMDGTGNMIFPDGKRYSGEFKNDKRSGWGILSEEGGHYEGLWLNDAIDLSNNKYREDIKKLL
jgi:hypothetical protein